MNVSPITSPNPKGIKRYNALPIWIASGVIALLLIWVILSTERPIDEVQQGIDQQTATEMARLDQKQKYQGSPWYSTESVPTPQVVTVLDDESGEENIIGEGDINYDIPLSEFEIKIQEIHDKAALEREQYIARLPQRRLEQKEDGIRSPLKVISLNTNNSHNSNINTNRSKSYTQDNTNSSAILQRMGKSGITGDMGSYNAQNMQDEKINFLAAAEISENYLTRSIQAPLSPYEIKAGTVLPSALITGINSDLPGSITAQIREHVYDTASGNHLLIPQGAKLIGSYDSSVSFGQNRVLVVWNRLIFPDGKSISLEKMQGVDISGYAGFNDKVDHHYGRIYGNALLLSLVGAGYELLVNNNDNSNDNDPQDTVAAQVGLQLAQVTNQISRRNINIQPTINIRPGYRFNIMVMKDIILEPLSVK